MAKKQIKLKVISEPAPKTRAIVVLGKNSKNPIFYVQDKDGIDYLCGSCGIVLVHNIKNDSPIKGIVLQCIECDAFNELDPRA